MIHALVWTTPTIAAMYPGHSSSSFNILSPVNSRSNLAEIQLFYSFLHAISNVQILREKKTAVVSPMSEDACDWC